MSRRVFFPCHHANKYTRLSSRVCRSCFLYANHTTRQKHEAHTGALCRSNSTNDPENQNGKHIHTRGGAPKKLYSQQYLYFFICTYRQGKYRDTTMYGVNTQDAGIIDQLPNGNCCALLRGNGSNVFVEMYAHAIYYQKYTFYPASKLHPMPSTHDSSSSGSSSALEEGEDGAPPWY